MEIKKDGKLTGDEHRAAPNGGILLIKQPNGVVDCFVQGHVLPIAATSLRFISFRIEDFRLIFARFAA